MTLPAWSGGYVADTPYVAGWHASQWPALLALACAVNDVAWAPPDPERLAYVELGCGRGHTALALAAANPGWRVVGLDYMPAQVAEAREIAAEAGLGNAEFLEADLAALDDAAAARLLPEADVVTLHGVWTWVSDAVRAGVLAVLRSRLRAGGIAMVSYNALPGWADGLAVQRLLASAATRRAGPSDRRGAEALEALRVLAEAGAAHLEGSSAARRLLRAPEGVRPAYVAHEFLTEHWRPAFAPDVIRAMQGAKLDHVGAADLVENFAALTLTPAQRAAVEAWPAGPDRELAVDTCLRRGFRQDVFVRGRRPTAGAAVLRATRLCLLAAPAAIRPRVTTPLGEASLPPPVAEAAIGALAEGPRSVEELLALPPLARTTAGELVAVLVGGGSAAPLWRDPPGDPAAREACARFVAAAAAHHGAELRGGAPLAVPVPALGGAVACGPTELMAMAALLSGAAPPEAAALARRLLRPDAPPEALASAEADVGRMLAERMAVWRMLGML